MGNVAITLKIMPDSPERDLDKIREEISKKVKIQDYNTEDIAFGLKALRILIIKPDTGGTEDIEKQIKEIEGVGGVEVESVTLV